MVAEAQSADVVDAAACHDASGNGSPCPGIRDGGDRTVLEMHVIAGPDDYFLSMASRAVCVTIERKCRGDVVSISGGWSVLSDGLPRPCMAASDRTQPLAVS